jgi:acetyltransferase-like isoleucine patch superfamily enzyme
MSSVNRLSLRVGRAQTPLFRLAKKIIRQVVYPTLPPLPRILLSPLRVVYELHFGVIVLFRSLRVLLYCNPLFQARCTAFGKGVAVEGLPFITGPVELHIGNEVKIGGGISVQSGRLFDVPRVVVRDRAAIGWCTSITVNQEVVIEEDVIVAPYCRITDSDGHPREADLRAAGKPPHTKDVRPVHIGRYAWIGTGAYVMKGVTIGEGAIVAANSVVLNDIPPYSLAVGNPAEVLFRNYGKPSTAQKNSRPPTASDPSPDSVPAHCAE